MRYYLKTCKLQNRQVELIAPTFTQIKGELNLNMRDYQLYCRGLIPLTNGTCRIRKEAAYI